MSMYCRWSLLRGVSGTPGLAAAVVFAWGSFAATESFAQQETVIIGGSGLPEIEINLDVLDRLAPAAGPSTPGVAIPPAGPVIAIPEPVGIVEKSALEPSPPAVEEPAIKEPAVKEPAVAKKTVEPVTPPARPSMKATVDPPPAPPPKPALEITPPPVMPVVEKASSTAPDEAVAAVTAKATTPPSESTQIATVEATPEPAPSVDSAAAAGDLGTSEPANPAVPSPKPSAGSNGEDTSEVAALSPEGSGATAKTDTPLLIEFDEDSTRLPKESWDDLKGFARQLLKSDGLRVQVKAYAGSPTISASAARRLSLSRALSVRAFLIERGVRSTRIDVRALGNQSGGGPSERVDVVLVNR